MKHNFIAEKIKKLGNFKTGLKFYKNPAFVSICTMMVQLLALKTNKQEGYKSECEDLWRVDLICWYCVKTDETAKIVCERRKY